MLQKNLIFGIQNQIKKNKNLNVSSNFLEETSNQIIQESHKEHDEVNIVLESSFIADIYSKSEKSKRKEEIKKSVVMESFNLRKINKKLEKDSIYFNYLYENFVDESFKEKFKNLLENIFLDVIKLHEECDITPRLLTPAVDVNDLTESQIEDIYKNNLNKLLQENYVQPVLNKTLSELYENEIKEITKTLITEGVDIDLNSIKLYMPFEEAIYQFNKKVLIPEPAEKAISTFMESLTEEYKQFVEESAEDILNNIEKKIRLLTSIVAPNIFNKTVEASGVDAPKIAGITIIVDKNFKNNEDSLPENISNIPEDVKDEIEDEEEANEIDNILAATTSGSNMPEDEDYEAFNAELEAEKSVVQHSDEVGEEPGAVELDLGMTTPDSDTDNNVPVNKSDLDLQGDGQDNGELGPDGAQLPGGIDANSQEIDVPIEFDDDNEETTDIETVKDDDELVENKTD